MIIPLAILFILLACLGIAYIVRKNRLSAKKRVAFLDYIEKAPPSEWDRDSTRYEWEPRVTSTVTQEYVGPHGNTVHLTTHGGAGGTAIITVIDDDPPLNQEVPGKTTINKFPYYPQRTTVKTTAKARDNCLYTSSEPHRLEDFSSIHIATAMLADAILTSPSESANTDTFSGSGGDFGGGGASGSWDSGSSDSSSSSYDSGSSSFDSGGGSDSGSFGSD